MVLLSNKKIDHWGGQHLWIGTGHDGSILQSLSSGGISKSFQWHFWFYHIDDTYICLLPKCTTLLLRFLEICTDVIVFIYILFQNQESSMQAALLAG